MRCLIRSQPHGRAKPRQSRNAGLETDNRQCGCEQAARCAVGQAAGEGVGSARCWGEADLDWGTQQFAVRSSLQARDGDDAIYTVRERADAECTCAAGAGVWKRGPASSSCAARQWQAPAHGSCLPLLAAHPRRRDAWHTARCTLHCTLSRHTLHTAALRLRQPPAVHSPQLRGAPWPSVRPATPGPPSRSPSPSRARLDSGARAQPSSPTPTSLVLSLHPPCALGWAFVSFSAAPSTPRLAETIHRPSDAAHAADSCGLFTTARGQQRRYDERVARRASGAQVLVGDERPMAHPHVAIARRRTLTSADDRLPLSAVPPHSDRIASSPVGPQLHLLHSLPEDVARCKTPSNHPKLAARLAAVRMPMPFQLSSWHAQWLGRLRSALRLLVIVLSGAVLVFLGHTLEIFRGNRYIDLRKNELPMTWPARTNLAPTLILFTVTLGSFIASVTVVALSFKRSFRRPTRSAGVYRVAGGCCGVLLWILAIAEFSLLDRASKASLGRYSCGNSHILSNGRYQYRAVCEEQVSQPHPQPRGTD